MRIDKTKEHTLEEKLDYLEKVLGYRPTETELHPKEGMGTFEWEVNQDYRQLSLKQIQQ